MLLTLLTPADNKEYFYVTYDDNKFFLHQEAAHDISEDRLPAEGYFLYKSGKESITVNIPTKDKGLFTELTKRFGWTYI